MLIVSITTSSPRFERRDDRDDPHLAVELRGAHRLQVVVDDLEAGHPVPDLDLIPEERDGVPPYGDHTRAFQHLLPPSLLR